MSYVLTSVIPLTETFRTFKRVPQLTLRIIIIIIIIIIITALKVLQFVKMTRNYILRCPELYTKCINYQCIEKFSSA